MLYLAEGGFTVCLISWRSATEALGHLTWSDYEEMGPITALRLVCDITGMGRPNVLGCCIRGPILCSALAVLRAHGEDPVENLTLPQWQDPATLRPALLELRQHQPRRSLLHLITAQ